MIMARVITPKDAYAIMNALVKQATGQTNVAITDQSGFVSAGETVLATGMENVINSLNIVLARSIVASRPYKGKLNLMQAESNGVYSNRLRKISFYSKEALPSGALNTDLFTNLADGYTSGDNNGSSTKSQWEQHQPIALEMNFGGSSTWQDCITMYDHQLQIAFRDESEFARFVSGYLTEHGNDIEQQKEAFNRMALLNKIGSTYHLNQAGSVINLTSAYNTAFGTSYTSAQLRTTYLTEFLAFFVATFKECSRFMTERSVKYHWNPQKTVNSVTYDLLRHTPYDRQRVYLYAPLFIEAEALVLPEIFNEGYLDLDTQYQEITYWQGISNRPAINIKPAVIDPSTGQQMATAPTVALDYVVGLLVDADGLMTDFMLDRADTTPMEARKHYRNTWLTIQKNAIDDPTENAILFIMAD